MRNPDGDGVETKIHLILVGVMNLDAAGLELTTMTVL
jgi:hypothetical protein